MSFRQTRSPFLGNKLGYNPPYPLAEITGTIIGATEADIVAGGKTIIITLTNNTWVAAGATFDAQRQNIIDGLVSAGSDTFGWNNVVVATQGVSGVVRTSDTVVTITLDAFATYDITSNETITATVPSTSMVIGTVIVATPTFTITAGGVTTAIRDIIMSTGIIAFRR